MRHFFDNSELIEEMIFSALEDRDDDRDDREDEVEEPEQGDWGDVDPNGGEAPTAPGSAV